MGAVDTEGKMKRSLLMTALVVVLGLALAYVYFNRSVPATNALWPSSPYQSEDEWIVGQTAVAVVDLAQFVKTSAPAPLATLALSRMTTSPDNAAIALRVGSRDVAISLKTYVWDPDAYVDLARTQGATAGRVPSADNEEIVKALLELKVETLQVQNDAVSLALQTDYRNPANHEAAALLLTAFALREAAYYFYDPRLVLCRAAAHLAVARALRGAGGPSQAGQLADVVLQVLVGRTAPAMEALGAFETTYVSPASQSWARALRRRASLDWREPVSADSPLLERLEYVRALAHTLGSSQSLGYYMQHDTERIPDWGWITLDMPFSVASGHAFVDDTIEQTMSEAAQVLGISDDLAIVTVDTLLSREPAVSSLDRAGAGIRVLDDGTWSAFYRRELEHVAEAGSEFYGYLLGRRDTAKAFEAQMDRLLGRQPLWPIVQRLRVEAEPASAPAEKKNRVAAAYKSAMTSVAPIFRERPQSIPYVAWLYASAPPQGVRPIDVPQASLWFRTIYPTGTAFESRRMNVQKIIPNDFVAHADAIHALSPWTPPVVINWSLVKCRNGCTLEQERANYGPLADYHLDTMERLAKRNPNPEPEWRRLCQISAADCQTLGDWYKSHERLPEAAAAYQDFFDHERDRIGASNGIEWLVRYYQKTGRGEAARRTAQTAEAVGSARGMEALAGVLEREGNPSRAGELYRNIYTRYDKGERLLAFLLRRADAAGVAPSGSEYTTLLQRYFSGSLERVSAASLAGPPDRGLFVAEVGEWNQRYFQTSDIVVAMDGIRVWTNPQMAILYDRSFTAPLHYTVWRGDRYLDVTGPFRDYYYGVDAQEYPPPRSPAR